MWKCNFPNLLISDLLSASDKLESLFLGSPFRNRSSGSWLIAFYTLPLWWPVIKKQTNSNCSCEKPRSLWIKYEQSLPCRQAAGLKKWLTSWRCNWRCGQTDRQQRQEDINGEMGKPAQRQPDDGVVGRGVGRRDCLTDSRRRTGGRADRQLRRSTGSHTVRLCYPGNEQLISHSQITEFSSIFIVPGGQLGRANGQTLGQGDRRGRQDGRDRQTSRETVAQRTAGHSTHTPAAAMLHATLVLS